MSDVETYTEADSKIELSKDAPASFSVSDAARLMAEARATKAAEAKKTQEAPPEKDKLVFADTSQESEAQAEDVAPDESPAPDETQEAKPEDEELPPIGPPRSWTKDARERWQSLPRETQEYLAEREQERERELRRGQNEAAELRKAIEAERMQLGQTRQHYESALPQLLYTLQATQQGEFADIKTIADVEKLAREDWPRYLQWDVAQKKVAAIQQEMLVAQQRQQQEKMQSFNQFAAAEDARFTELAPEMADKEKAEKLRNGAVQTLKDLGFSDTELSEAWSGQKDLSLRDHRIQLLIRDAYRMREAEAKLKNVTTQKKPVPQVQRPGTARPAGSAQLAKVDDLTKRLPSLKGTKAIDAAFELMKARRAARQ